MYEVVKVLKFIEEAEIKDKQKLALKKRLKLITANNQLTISQEQLDQLLEGLPDLQLIFSAQSANLLAQNQTSQS